MEISLRKLEAKDKVSFFAYIAHDKDVLQTFMCKYEDSLETFNFDRYLKLENTFAIVNKQSDEMIGIILIYKDNKNESTCEIGYAIGKPFWNQGIATIATKMFIDKLFAEYKYTKIFASYFVGNNASKRVMEKVGMKYSHTNKKELVYLGLPRDLDYYYITNDKT